MGAISPTHVHTFRPHISQLNISSSQQAFGQRFSLNLIFDAHPVNSYRRKRAAMFCSSSLSSSKA